MQNVIEVHDLTKAYGDLVAVDHISFAVARGEIFGIVGPNGAGKTTTVECIEGLRRLDGGNITLLGMAPGPQRLELAQRIGVQLQSSALPPRLRVGEALALFGGLYDRQAAPEELLDLLGLADKRKAAFGKLSGGQKQRLFIALSLVNRPEIVFFDELTTGLDPQARRAMWDLVRRVRDRGCTVVLTTHFMEEAERLCDRVLIMDHGRIVALDTPEALIGSLDMDRRLVFTLPNGAAAAGLDSGRDDRLRGLSQVTQVEMSSGRLVVHGNGERFVSSVVYAMEDLGVPFTDLRTEQPSLEDVFLTLTGREMRE